jgi:adenosylcobinamide-GDP ribazoletransferase
MRDLKNPAKRELRRLLAAVQYFTRLPSPAWVGHDPTPLEDSVRYFPAVGLVVGAMAAAVLLAAHVLWPMTVAVAVSMIATILITGALHEDGLADAMDGLGGSFDRGRALEIMKDSRIGVFGAIALGLALLLKFATLSAAPVHTAALLLVAGHAASRFGVVIIMASLPYARPTADSRSTPLAQPVAITSVAIAGVTAVFSLLPLRLAGVVGAVLVCITCLGWRRYLQHRLGGYTGDCLGAAQQMGECVFYLACTAVH